MNYLALFLGVIIGALIKIWIEVEKIRKLMEDKE